jgi:hypothetical protein
MSEENNFKKIEVETLAGDMTKVIEGSTGASIKEIIHQQEGKKESKKNTSFNNPQNKIFIFGGFLLLIIALVFLFFLFKNKGEDLFGKNNSQYVPLIFYDQNSFLEIDDLNKQKIIQAIVNKVSSSEIKKEGIEAIYLTLDKKIIGLNEFTKIIESNISFEKNSFVSDNFLLGLVNKESKDFFILIKVRSTADIFKDMISWENKMFYDLSNFWNLEINSETAYLLSENFEDEIIQNKNARVLYDEEGNIVLMYVFVADDFVLMAQKEETVQEIILRLASNKIRK